MKIIQIYPFNNPVSKTNTKPVVLAGISYVKYSKFYRDIKVISSYTSSPYNEQVITLPASNKKQYNKAIQKYLLELPETPKVIELHQDTKLAARLAKIFKGKSQVSLIKHGPDIYSRIYEKFILFRMLYAKLYLKNIAYIFGVSNYITGCFTKNYPQLKHKFKTLYNNYGHLNLAEVDFNLPKKNIIMFAGKPIKIKGIFEFMRAMPAILNKFNNWHAVIVGAFFSNKSKYKSTIGSLINETEIKQLIERNQIIFYQNLAVDEVLQKLQQAKILVIPSVFQEVFGLIALEAHIAGCIVVSSGTGGLKEVSDEFAYYLDEVNSNNIIKAINYILNNLPAAEELAKLGKENAMKKFNPQQLVVMLDNIRAACLM